MTTQRSTSNITRRCPDVPHHAWYAAATTEEVGRAPLGRRVLGVPVVLYRTSSGAAVALEDRCSHRPVPLSDGYVAGDDIVASYTGFRYGSDGRCVGVPTQQQVPFGAAVRTFPVHDDGSFVWVWPGDPKLAALRPAPDTGWLRDAEWSTFGDAWETQASVSLLLDNFGDITHVAHVDPDIVPPALEAGAPPPLQVTVTETTMRFARDYPPAPLADWHSQVLELQADAAHAQREEGEFVSPGLWVDRWHVTVAGHGEADGRYSFVFTHALTPVDERTTRHVWRVSRNFSDSAAAEGTLAPIFGRYYARVRTVLETMQRVVDEDGPRPEVRVAADAAASAVRRIMERLVAEETGTR
jgi:phenylpropionate dioxygenase-like ring-hydroxylating dioxygenase large terminal subunit